MAWLGIFISSFHKWSTVASSSIFTYHATPKRREKHWDVTWVVNPGLKVPLTEALSIEPWNRGNFWVSLHREKMWTTLFGNGQLNVFSIGYRTFRKKLHWEQINLMGAQKKCSSHLWFGKNRPSTLTPFWQLFYPIQLLSFQNRFVIFTVG